jgi:hypothetical protein
MTSGFCLQKTILGKNRRYVGEKTIHHQNSGIYSKKTVQTQKQYNKQRTILHPKKQSFA